MRIGAPVVVIGVCVAHTSVQFTQSASSVWDLFVAGALARKETACEDQPYGFLSLHTSTSRSTVRALLPVVHLPSGDDELPSHLRRADGEL